MRHAVISSYMAEWGGVQPGQIQIWELDFAGFTVTDSGVKPTKRMLEAIRDFPKPTNLTGQEHGLA